MAMLSVVDLLPAMAALRAAYSGTDPLAAGLSADSAPFRRLGNGFVQHGGRLLRMMGERATASTGAVVAHHQAPLAAVMRELRLAEKRAKETRRSSDNQGRDAFSITVVKRSGGALHLTARWGEAMRLLIALRDFLAEPDVSRRAVYNSAVWLTDLPEPEGNGEMPAQMLAYQLARQTASKATRDRCDLPLLASGLILQAVAHTPAGARLAWLQNFLSLAELLAREGRAGD
jgi:CRISPR-associated protein Cmr2